MSFDQSAQPPVPDGTPDISVLEEAADWVMAFHYGAISEPDRAALERWLQQSAEHALAWQRAQTVLGTFDQVPALIGTGALTALQRSQRRRSLQALGTLLVAAPVGWLAYRQLPWQQWSAEMVTATGERKAHVLSDGTRLVLNTASAVDVVFNASERRITLHAGEILVTTHVDPSPIHRPFLVQTPQGVVQALGTRFSVRSMGSESHVAVYEHAVEIRPHGGAAITLRGGSQADFNSRAVQPPARILEDGTALWEQGMLLARNMRLADVVAEMGRYRVGVLRCHPSAAALRVSGAISLMDTDAGLALLERSLPLRVERTTRYWVTVRRQ